MAEAKDLAGAERCSLFLLDKYSGELVSKVFDGNEVNIIYYLYLQRLEFKLVFLFNIDH